ncbi:hypothetical protein Q6D67_04785 [Haliea sp. E1-2-M8]|uniref:hypothetical protein n=1 Tax=Haliea sp. E1-2-M8 TaxID=3064706 RepID=UPI00271EE8B6|nr:hypothetical protein [Haliea sp. E1-2-M8]MDO8861011.1 hypothetical protein [Haliea sp. E1-2-M8]
MSVTPEQMRRLAFAKYLFLDGFDKSHLPRPMSAAALLLFHDSIELVLYLAVEVSGGTSRKELNFMGYWPEYRKLTQRELPFNQPMNALNKSRVALKHHATLPSEDALERYRVTCNQFLIEVSATVFGTEFEAISLLEFVQPDNCKEQLVLAERYLDESDFTGCSASLARAFSMLMCWAEEHYADEFFDSPFAFGMDTYHHIALSAQLQAIPDCREFSEFVQDVSKTLSRVKAAMPILAHGIPFGEFVRFNRYLPSVSIMMDGAHHVTFTGREKSCSEEYLRHCIQFVIEQSIRIQSRMGDF